MTDNPRDAEQLAELVAAIKSARATGADDWHRVPLRDAEVLVAGLDSSDATIADLERQRNDWKQHYNDAVITVKSLGDRIEQYEDEIADLERRLAEARASVDKIGLVSALLEAFAHARGHRDFLERARNLVNAFIPDAPPPPVAEAGGEVAAFRKNVDKYVDMYMEIIAPQPTADHTGRARALVADWRAHVGWDNALPYLEKLVIDALTTAEHAGAEKMRALDEAAIEAARKVVCGLGYMAETQSPSLYELRRALAARDAALTEDSK